MNRIGFEGAARYRTVPEPRIVEILLLSGWAYEARGPLCRDAELQAAAALQRWIDAGLGFEQRPSGERCFDPVETLNFGKRAGADGDLFWHEHFVATAQAMVREFHRETLPVAGPPPHLRTPQRFELTIRRTFGPGTLVAGERVRLRLPLPLEDGALRDLNVTFVTPAGLDAEHTIAPGRLDVMVRAAETPVTLEANVAFAAWPVGPGWTHDVLSAQDIALYTQPNEGLVQVTPRVQEIADKLGGTGRDRLASVRAYLDFFFRDLHLGMVHYDAFPAASAIDYVLDNRWFDCRTGSALLVALCRARSIPARVCSGFLLYSVSPTYHTWAEVWIPDRGWVPLDLVVWDLSEAGDDTAWCEYFFGYLDYRMKTEVFPHAFTGSPTVKLPASWRLEATSTPGGATTAFYDVESGALVYQDEIAVRTA